MTSRCNTVYPIAQRPRLAMRAISIVLMIASGVASAADEAILSQTAVAANADRESDAPKVAFVTSVTGTGNLSSWTDAHGKSGIEAGDEICRTRADAAGLDNPDMFRAWLSDATTDAYCHIQGQTGTIANHCDTFLLLGAGPWVRTDGEPFADVIDQVVTNYRIYSPLLLDEFGMTAPGYYYTGTSQNGVSEGSDETCASWTNESSGGPPYTLLGDSASTGSSWTIAANFPCGFTHRLACLEGGSASTLPQPSPRGGRMAFLSSTTSSGLISFVTSTGGTLIGVAAGDARCRQLAAAANLYDPQSFKALVGTTTVPPTDRFENDGPWSRTDGLLFARSLAELTTGTGPVRPLNVDESGDYYDYAYAWTGPTSTDTCSNWTAADSTLLGWKGDVDKTGNRFLAWTTQSCDVQEHVYCLSDSDVLFHDGYEGTLSGLPD